MGDTAVDFFLKTLRELITSSELSLIIQERHQFESLEEEILYLRGFLKDTEKKRNDHPEVMELVMQIRDLVSEAENIVELFVIDAFRADHASSSLREHQDHPPLDLESVKKGMKTLTAEVKKIYDENVYDIDGVAIKLLKQSSTESRGGSGSSRGSHTSKEIKEEVVLGFEEEVERLIDKLDDRGEGRPLEIISIIGVGGGGKTTLAKKVYDHPFTSFAFEIRAWINVSQDYDETRRRNLLICILESVIPGNYEKSSDDKLGEDVLKCLDGKKYLIVMDDIWGIEVWNDIQISLPKERNGSKVLFTSRLHVQPDSVSYIPHYLAPLSKNWCWELLEKKIFGMKRCPPELVDIGEQIAEKCNGRPLAVVAIAGYLATQDKTLDVWEKVAKRLSSVIGKNQEGVMENQEGVMESQEGIMEVLELSYNLLSLHLKACFLYIGGYAEDKEIPVRELIWLWIAEGFIQQSEQGQSLETIAKFYLIDLVNRSLVQIARKSPLGEIKACRIHGLLRELCLKKVEDDNFLVKVYDDDSFSPSATNTRRRLFTGTQFFERFSLRARNLRSFLCLSLRERNKSRIETNFLLERNESRIQTNFSFFVENFKLLRVLNFLSGSCYGEIGIGHLVHLRYLAYSFYGVRALPFPYLLNLETLNLKSPEKVIKLPRDIFKMVKLRHLYTKEGVFNFHLSRGEVGSIGCDRSSKLDNLQTLHRICACEACRSFLIRTPNLRKLGLHGGVIPEDNVLRFPNLECFKCLETLTFTTKLAFDSTVESTLPPGLKLPLTITRITLKNTCLKWEELSLLQTLPSLEVLKLLDYACCGPVWNTSELEGFPQLMYLRFYDLDIKEWIASEDQFPKLEVLVLEFCRELEQIPIDFANLHEFRKIKLECCRCSVIESAEKIQDERRNRNGDDVCLNFVAIYNWD